MPDYAYKAADASGAITRGIRFAQSEDELSLTLKQAGLLLLESKAGKTTDILNALERIQIGRIHRSELVEFSNNMGVMIRAGIPLIRAMDELREDLENSYFKKVIGEMIEQIQAGATLTEAMTKKPRVFPKLYVNVVQIGERTGSLDVIFFDLARHYKRLDALVRNIQKAMMYPSFVFVALIIVSFIFLSLVFPPLFALLQEFDVSLPVVTRVIMGVSEVLQNQWLEILAGIVLLAFLFFFLRRKTKIKYYFDRCELHIPFLRRLLIQLRISFFMRYLALLLGAGIDILRALQLATESVNNLEIQKFLIAARQRVLGGDLFSDALRGARFFPNMVIRMIAIGEESGNLPEQMGFIADYYNEELERRIATTLAIMEPVLLFFLAGLALALVMGVLLPLYNMVTQLSSGIATGATL